MFALLASLFTKPTAVDAVLACLVFVFLTDRRRAAWALALLLGSGLVLLIWLTLATHGAFWLNVVEANANPFDLAELGKYAVNFCAIHAVGLVVAGREAWKRAQRRAWSPWAIAFPISGVVALSVGKWGAGESYLLVLIAVTSVLAGAGIARLLSEGAPNTRSRQMWFGLAFVGQMLLFAHGPFSNAIPMLPDLGRQAEFLGHIPSAADRAAADGIVATMRQGDGPVLSEAPTFMIAAGKPVVANATHLRNLSDAGLWDPAPLVADVRAHRFDVVVLNAQLYPAAVLAAIGQSYYLARTIRIGPSTYQVFLPGAD
jgi:hypothetical protein